MEQVKEKAMESKDECDGPTAEQLLYLKSNAIDYTKCHCCGKDLTEKEMEANDVPEEEWPGSKNY